MSSAQLTAAASAASTASAASAGAERGPIVDAPGGGPVVSSAHVLQALSDMRPSVPPLERQRYNRIYTKFATGGTVSGDDGNGGLVTKQRVALM